MFLEQDGDYRTKIDIVEMCGCSQKNMYTDYYDISVYNNYVELIEWYNEELAIAMQYGDIVSQNQIVAQMDFELSNYLSMVTNNPCGRIKKLGVLQ